MNERLRALAGEVEREIAGVYRWIDEVALANHRKTLDAFHEYRVSEFHFRGSTGYGYGDPGREVLDRVWARVFGAESALVRTQIVSGTHALALAFYGLCRPGDQLVAVGRPYDTLERVIGIKARVPGSLTDLGVGYRQVDLDGNGRPDKAALVAALTRSTKVVFLQRSGGYDWRPALDIEAMAGLIGLVKSHAPHARVVVDNCYGEFTEVREPSEVGADLVCGSLIKNPGGGLAPTGGYVAGCAECVELAAARLTAPGLGREVGASLYNLRLLYQGFYLAPHFVSEALKGAVFSARLMERLGYEVKPGYADRRSDTIQGIRLGTPERVIAFCRGIQKASPVDAHAFPEPAPLPGYADGVVMAAGTFVQGASLELTADAPFREPFAVYLQGGLSREYVKLGVLTAIQEMNKLQ
ncbi:MAG: methionine gamma-lyase family protein [Candidatus Desulforudis sp.]|nr:methionine gamma-lyase family protein [Desulforudis sp.]